MLSIIVALVSLADVMKYVLKFILQIIFLYLCYIEMKSFEICGIVTS